MDGMGDCDEERHRRERRLINDEEIKHEFYRHCKRDRADIYRYVVGMAERNEK